MNVADINGEEMIAIARTEKKMKMLLLPQFRLGRVNFVIGSDILALSLSHCLLITTNSGPLNGPPQEMLIIYTLIHLSRPLIDS